MIDEQKESRFFEIKIIANDQEMYSQKFHENYIMRYDPDFIERMIASVNQLHYEPKVKNA